MKPLAISFELLGELEVKLGERASAIKQFHRACPLIEFVGYYDGMGGSSFPLNQRCIDSLRRLCDSDRDLEDSCKSTYEKIATYQAWRHELLSWKEAQTSQTTDQLDQFAEKSTKVDENLNAEEDNSTPNEEQVIPRILENFRRAANILFLFMPPMRLRICFWSLMSSA